MSIANGTAASKQRWTGARLTAEEIANALPQGRKSGGGWKACCPAHEDKNPSLSLGQQGEKVLVHCHARCSQEAVVAALRERGLWGSNGTSTRPAKRRPAKKRIPGEVRPFAYKDADQHTLFWVHRKEGTDGKKKIWRDPPKADCPPGPDPLFRLCAVLRARPEKPLLVVEGENVCRAAVRWLVPGYCLVTSAGGSSAAGKTDWSPVKDRRVVIWPDNDDAGQRYAQQVATLCQQAGAASVAVVQVPEGLPAGWDLADDIPETVDLDIPALLREAAPVAAAPRYEDLNMAALLNLPATKIDWLVEGMFPAYGNVSLLAGQPKAGKSTVARSLAVAVAQGNLWLGRQVKQGPVYHLCLEDRPIAVKRHLKRLGVRETDPYTIRFGGVPAGEEAYSWLREKIKEVRPALIVIDTLIHFFRLQDTSSYGEVFTKTQPLVDIATQTETPILLVHHASKGQPGGRRSRVEPLGSQRFFGMAETLLSVQKMDNDRRLISTQQREGRDLEPTPLIMHRRTDRVDLEPPPAREQRTTKREKVTAMKEEILRYLARKKAPVMTQQILGAIHGSQSQKLPTLRQLVEAGKVRMKQDGKKHLYRITQKGRVSLQRNP